MSNKLRVLAVGAHPADVPKRAGGTLVRYVEEGHKVCMATLSYGETMESDLLWKKLGMTVEKIKPIREREFFESAKILGVEPIVLGFEDNFPKNPLTTDKQAKVAEMIRKIRPHILLTHWIGTLYDDHRLTAKSVALIARNMAADPKKLVETGLEPWNVQDIYFYEPAERYAALTGFIEDVYIDVSDVWEKKLESLKPFWYSQRNNADYYTQVALYVGTQAEVKYAERFVQYRPKRVIKLFPFPSPQGFDFPSENTDSLEYVTH
jgi:4-oxalomesaconate hydratase